MNQRWIDIVTERLVSLKYPHLIYTVLAFTSRRLRKKLINIFAVAIAGSSEEMENG